MAKPPESFMIFREELAKARLEKKRIQQECDQKVKQLSDEMNILKEKMLAQEEMMKSALDYAQKLENELNSFKQKIDQYETRNSFGYH